ncbi:Ger(x)C family spore germination protein [Niallia endozanthoxylica]|uniref:Ger(X)C family spore germination protein n=1 Tax=Niallia endozanthoxylica TaxID=2036016 RepID=A0A5J5I5W3_9BACI|nr:Ger(x)C family spore germination protein [Niallia endozanthoxylica]KAA9031135.1 Ger(x)C family spore germination protein [Niallia endozanthoxylica]
MQQIKKVCKLLIIITLILSLTGCWDREELEENAYVIGLGIDRSKRKGKIKVTMLIANPEVGSVQGGGGSTEKPREIISFDANDFIAAKATANTIISRDISYELLKVIIVSEELAKDQDFRSVISSTLKDKEIRMDSYLAVCKEKASEYFQENHPKMETRPHKYFQFMIENGINNGLIPDSTLFRYFSAVDRGTDLFLAMYTTTEREKNPKFQQEDQYTAGQLNVSGEFDNTQFSGSAVFKNGVMVDQLNGVETRIINILDDTTDIKDVLVNIRDPFSESHKQLAAKVTKTNNNKIKMNLKGIRPKIEITVPLTLAIMSNPSMVNYAEDPKKQQFLKEFIVKDTASLFEMVQEKTQTELKGSPYPLSVYARKYFKTYQEFERFNWVKSYPKADVTIKTDIEIEDYGVQKKVLNNQED